MFSNSEAKLSEQQKEVQDYFKGICDKDEWGLDCDGFFQRVCNSILNNGTERTCKIYELELEIINKLG